MVKIGDLVKWDTKTKGMLSGKVIGGEKSKRWKIEKAGKTFYVEKERVKKGIIKKPKQVAKKKATTPVNKDLLQNVMGVMAEVAKEKGKSTQKGIDSKVALDKKARDGKLTLKAFSEEMFDDDDTSTVIYDAEEERQDVQSYNMDYWVSRVSKRADTWEDLTEKQQERLQEIMEKDVQKGTKEKMKAFWTKFIKGKKLKNMKAVNELFIKEYYGIEYD